MNFAAQGRAGTAMAEKPSECARAESAPAREPSGAVKAAEYRRLASEHEREAARCQTADARDLQLRLARAYRALAENEEWLDGKLPGNGAAR